MHPPTDKAAAEAGGSPRSLTFFWFKYTCACSWLIISTCVALFLCACLTVGGLDYVAQDICARPEVNASDEAACREAFTCFAECNDRYDIVTSARISQCLLASVDRDALSGWGATVHVLTPQGVTSKQLKGRMD